MPRPSSVSGWPCDFLTDRAWPATLVAFGPRWLAALPMLPLTVLVVLTTPGRVARRLIGPLALTGVALVVGFMDFRMGFGRVAGTPVLRIMTQNLGASRVTAEALDRLMKAERVDVAALQECPFYDCGAGALRLAFLLRRRPLPGEPLPVYGPRGAIPTTRGGAPMCPFGSRLTPRWAASSLLNVHLGTIRGGLEALRAGGSRALPQFARQPR